MLYEWDSLLESGIERIDSQHKQLVMALNDLVKACHSGESGVELTSAVDFLVTYTAQHFEDEEALQIQYKYVDYLRHRQIHREFRRVVEDIAERLRKEGPTAKLVEEVHSNMGDWLINHIKGDDFRLVTFITTQLLK